MRVVKPSGDFIVPIITGGHEAHAKVSDFAKGANLAQLATDAAGNTIFNSQNGDPLSIVVSKGGDQEIMAAQEWLKARSPDGVVELAVGKTYTISQPIEIDTSFIGVAGKGSVFNISGITSGAAVTLGASAASGDSRFARQSEFSGITLLGNPALGRDSQQVAIRAHTDTANASVRAVIERVKIRHAKTGVAVGSRAYMLKMRAVSVSVTKFCVQQEAGAVDFAEGVSLIDCVLFNSDCLMQDLGGQRWRIYGGHFDYFGDSTGTRVTADDRLIDLRASASLEAYGAHMEWNYGDYAGQTNAPINMVGNNVRLVIVGGVCMKYGGQDPYYAATIATDNISQALSIRDMKAVRLGRVGNATHDDCLVSGALANHTGDGAKVIIDNLMPAGTATSDLPSVPAYYYRGSYLRSGVDDPYAELIHRISVTGTAVVASANSPDGGIAARNSTGKMLKITGPGKVLISFPVYEPMRRHAWSFFLNSSAAAGTITVKERHSTFVQKWDGTTQAIAADARAGYGNATKTITGGGANQWDRVSWKDTTVDNLITPRMNNTVFAIEIDTTGMTSGALYIDDAGYSLM